MTPTDVIGDATLYRGDCLDVLPHLETGSVDCVVTDPPYPEIDRPYGRWTEAEWFALMNPVVAECRRVLKVSGSAVFVLQPNSERVGRMRTWLWDFIAKWSREWNMVQDVWWLNHGAQPTKHCDRNVGLLKPSMKCCVWLGSPDCYREQSAVLVEPSASTLADSRRLDPTLRYQPSGGHVRHQRCLATHEERGGVVPSNVLVMGNGADNKHPASTPQLLCEFWVNYLCPPGGRVLDPFMGSGTTGLCCDAGRSFVGVERDPGYYATARDRIRAFQFGPGGMWEGLS